MYTTKKYGMVYETVTESPRLSITVRSSIRLPLHMNVDVWRRHKYSFEDIQTTLNAFDCGDLWRFGNILGITCPLTNVIVSVTFPRYCTLHSKSVIIKRILEYVKQHYVEFNVNTNVLFTECTLYTPALPLHKLTYSDYDVLYKEVGHITTLGVGRICRSLTVILEGVPFVALYKTPHNHIYCVRIMSPLQHQHILQYVHCDEQVSLICHPLEVYIHGVLYYGVEEACVLGAHGEENNITIDFTPQPVL